MPSAERRGKICVQCAGAPSRDFKVPAGKRDMQVSSMTCHMIRPKRAWRGTLHVHSTVFAVCVFMHACMTASMATIAQCFGFFARKVSDSHSKPIRPFCMGAG
jgi:hypothetical protein